MLRVRSVAGSLRCGVLPVLAGTEQDKIASDNLRAIFLFSALPVLPTRGLQLAFNVELRSFPDVLAYNLRQPLPSQNAVPFCSVLPLIVPVLEAFVRGQTDPRDRNAARRLLHSGSWPTLPTKITLFTLFAMSSSNCLLYEHPLVLPHSRQR